jgi:hypothetical protein
MILAGVAACVGGLCAKAMETSDFAMIIGGTLAEGIALLPRRGIKWRAFVTT